MPNVRVLSNHERAWLAHQCTFREKIARFNISQFNMIKINHRVQMIIEIAEFTAKELFFHHLIIITVSKYYRFHDKNFLGNHKCTVSHYIIHTTESAGCNCLSQPLISAYGTILLMSWSIPWIFDTPFSSMIQHCKQHINDICETSKGLWIHK